MRSNFPEQISGYLLAGKSEDNFEFWSVNLTGAKLHKNKVV